MKFIKNRKDFKYDMLLENLNLSTNLANIINSIDSPVSKFLLLLHTTNVEKEPYRQDHLDVSDDRSYLTFDKGKSKVKFGRLINNLLRKIKDESETVSMSPVSNIKEKDIQKFIDDYNERVSRTKSNNEDITVLKGDDIYKVYQYCGKVSSSPLGNSCMIGKSKSRFDLYTLNPEKVMLATLWEDNEVWKKDGLIARALLWNTDSGEKIMDRIYFDNADAELKMKSWATNNGYLYRRYQDYDEEHAVLFVDKVGDTVTLDSLSVQLKRLNDDVYPYMDTFKFIDDSDCLTNTQQDDSIGRLVHTDGTYEPIANEKFLRDVFDNILEFGDVYINKPQGGKRKIDDLRDTGSVLVADDWSSFTELFDGHENETFIKDMLEGDSFQYFDYSYRDLGNNVDTNWSEISDKTKDRISEICTKIGKESKHYKDENEDRPITLFKATSREEFKDYMEKNPDLDYDDFLVSSKDEWGKVSKSIQPSDKSFKNSRYFTVQGDVVIRLEDKIENNDDFSEVKDAILYGYGEAQRLADEGEAYDVIIKSILDYFGYGKYKVDTKINIELDTDIIFDRIVDSGNFDFEDFVTSYSYSDGFVTTISKWISWYSIPTPEFSEPYYGFNGDSSKYIDEAVGEKLYDIE